MIAAMEGTVQFLVGIFVQPCEDVVSGYPGTIIARTLSILVEASTIIASDDGMVECAGAGCSVANVSLEADTTAIYRQSARHPRHNCC